MKNVIAVIVGLLAGMAVNMALIVLNTSVLYPAPEGMDMMNPDEMNAYVATLPAMAFVVVMAAHLGQAFVGGWVAAKLGSSRPIQLAMVIGIFSLVGGIMNMMTITEGPAWMAIELPLYLVVAWLAGRMVASGRAEVSE
jgi:hypothetical protein